MPPLLYDKIRRQLPIAQPLSKSKRNPAHKENWHAPKFRADLYLHFNYSLGSRGRRNASGSERERERDNEVKPQLPNFEPGYPAFTLPKSSERSYIIKYKRINSLCGQHARFGTWLKCNFTSGVYSQVGLLLTSSTIFIRGKNSISPIKPPTAGYEHVTHGKPKKKFR